ncbi:unnamed protein product [Calypogeia fissa]
MSGEGDDLLYQSATGALLFPDLTDNGDELDFTKDFFTDDLSHSNDLNGASYDSMGGDDLIAELEGQDVFTRLPTSSELDERTAFGVDAVDLKGGLALSSPTHTKPFANGQILPTYGSFQKPSINLAHMSNTGGFGGGGNCSAVSEMYMQQHSRNNNGISGLASPTSPALKSSGLLSPGATSEKLNSLSLEHHQIGGGYSPYRQTPFDVKGSVGSQSFSKRGPYSPVGVVVHNQVGGGVPGGDKRFPSSPLSSPSVSNQQNSNGISAGPYSTAGSQDLMAGNVITSVSDVMHSSPPPPHPVSSLDGSSPRSLSNSSGEGNDVDGMLVPGEGGGLKIQQNNKPLFLSSPGLAQRLGSAVDTSGFVDANGDALRPLSMQARSSAMQRSFSSHALGQLRNIAPNLAQGSGADQVGLSSSFNRIGGPSDVPSRLSNESGSPHNMQPQLSDLQNVHIRPLMQSMRRVHSTGDIQTLNGMAGGGTSPSSLDRANYEDGGFKIGRYTMEERKIRIHRYQQKRTQRNFNKKIKYACRKTLADSRPRVRGRFAKNDEVGEQVVKHENKDEDEEEDNLMGYEEEEFFVDEDSSGDLSDVLGMGGVKLENPPSKGVKLEHHHHALDRKQLLQT